MLDTSGMVLGRHFGEQDLSEGLHIAAEAIAQPFHALDNTTSWTLMSKHK